MDRRNNDAQSIFASIFYDAVISPACSASVRNILPEAERGLGLDSRKESLVAAPVLNLSAERWWTGRRETEEEKKLVEIHHKN